MKKEIFRLFMTTLVPVTLFSMQVHAESGDGFQLDEKGTVTIVSEHAAKEGVSSLQFSLSVNSADAARVEFAFEGSKAKITDFRYDKDAQKLNVYLAGVDALFAENTDSLTVGRLVVLDGNGGDASATVSVVEDSLQYVYGTELKRMEGVELPGTVQMGAAGQPTPPPEATPGPPSETPEPPSEPLETPPPTQEPQPEEPDPTQEPLPIWTPAPTQNPSSIEEDNSGDEGEDHTGGIPVVGKPGTSQGNRRPAATAKPTSTVPPRVEVVTLNTPKPKDPEPEKTEEPPLESEEDVAASAELPSEDVPEEDAGEKGTNWLFVTVGAAVVLFGGVVAGSAAILMRKPKMPGAAKDRKNRKRE